MGTIYIHGLVKNNINAKTISPFLYFITSMLLLLLLFLLSLQLAQTPGRLNV